MSDHKRDNPDKAMHLLNYAENRPRQTLTDFVPISFGVMLIQVP